MQHIIALIDDLLIFDALDALDEMDFVDPTYEELKEEYAEGAKPDFPKRLKQFVLSLGKEETPKEEKIEVKNTIKSQGNNNAFITGVVNSTIGDKKDKKAGQKILFMAANPKDSLSLNLTVEYRTLQQEMRQGSKRDDFEWLQPIFAATLPEMMRGLAQEPTIIHFSGHGYQDGIVLEDADQYMQEVSNKTLELLFKDLKGITKIIILNCCYSASQAQFLSELGCSVLGYNTAVDDDMALTFAKGFYLGLSDGKSFDGALNYGRALVMGEHAQKTLPLSLWQEGKEVVLS